MIDILLQGFVSDKVGNVLDSSKVIDIKCILCLKQYVFRRIQLCYNLFIDWLTAGFSRVAIRN